MAIRITSEQDLLKYAIQHPSFRKYSFKTGEYENFYYDQTYFCNTNKTIHQNLKDLVRCKDCCLVDDKTREDLMEIAKKGVIKLICGKNTNGESI